MPIVQPFHPTDRIKGSLAAGALTAIVIVMPLGQTSLVASTSHWLTSRAEVRQNRAELREAAFADSETRAEHAATEISTLMDQVQAGEVVVAKEDLWQLLAGLGRLSPKHLGELPDRLRGLEVSAKKTNPAGQKALDEARGSITQRPWELLRKAVEIGHVQMATEFMWEVLFFDPDFKPIRKALGQRRVNPDQVEKLKSSVQISGDLVERMPEIQNLHPNKYWFSPFDAARLNQGLWWDDRFGWIKAKNPDRYEQGFVYDHQRRKWTTRDEANAFHAKPGRDWIIQTEHLLIKGTANLGVLAEVADRLESLYDEIFITYPNFFTDSRRVDVMRYALGLAEHEPFVVWVYADRAEYISRANAVRWSGGIFRPSTGMAYFYGRPSGIMYHEFTHQVLHVMTGQNRSPSWLTEGIAEYTQTVTFGIRGAEFHGAPADGSWSVDEIFSLRGGDDWYRAVERSQRKNRSSPYGPSGSLVTFSLQDAGQRHQTDFVDFLRDSYRGQTGTRDIWDYMGISERTFRQRYDRWLHQKQDDGGSQDGD